jgi:SAM-dependent methyltransferase
MDGEAGDAGLSQAVSRSEGATTRPGAWSFPERQRPRSRWSDLWKAPFHDLPVRDEILFQYLPLSSSLELLEIGPGSGFTAFRLARQVKQLTLVDVARQSIARLEQALRGIPNVALACADVCQPGLGERLGRRYDAAYAIEVFELLPDPGVCLGNLHDSLRPGGTLLLQFPNYPPPRNPGITYFRTRDELDRLMAQAGFRDWAVYSLKLAPWAHALYQGLHERPLRFYRRLRSGRTSERPLVYDESWAFQHGRRLEIYKTLLHVGWGGLLALMRLGGPCFQLRELGSNILNHNLMVLAHS